MATNSIILYPASSLGTQSTSIRCNLLKVTSRRSEPLAALNAAGANLDAPSRRAFIVRFLVVADDEKKQTNKANKAARTRMQPTTRKGGVRAFVLQIMHLSLLSLS